MNNNINILRNEMQITIWHISYKLFKIQDCKKYNMIIVKYNDGDNELILYDDVVTVIAKAH